MLPRTLQSNDRLAYRFTAVVSIIVFTAVVVLSRVKLDVDLGFSPHVFAAINAIINSVVSMMLVIGLLLVKQKRYKAHKNVMLFTILLSVLFLVSYIAHHLFAGETKFGGSGGIKVFYYIILISHILLAAVILPFILITAYRGLTGEYDRHKKITRITWPLWFYVSVTGVIVYLMISPYYT